MSAVAQHGRGCDAARLEAMVAQGLDWATRSGATGYNTRPGALCEIDLHGGVFVLDRPLRLRNLQLVRLSNGTLRAGPGLAAGAFLIAARRVTGIALDRLVLDCRGRANGVRLDAFFRVRIEGCDIRHPRGFGIRSAPEGNNHELEVMGCRLTAPPGVPPRATGIFLGQADNLVADCALSGFAVGIHCGMRANRIVGTHIRGAPGPFPCKGIEAHNFHKSSAIIHHNRFEDCPIWICCDDHPRLNVRNYFHIADNLFQSRPDRAAADPGHIVIEALKPASKLGNVQICDNLFCPQDGAPDDAPDDALPHIVQPLRVQTHVNPETGVESGMDPKGVTGFRMDNNQFPSRFSGRFPGLVQPMGSTVTKTVAVQRDRSAYFVSFRAEIPIGALSHASAAICALASGTPRPPVVRTLEAGGVWLDLPDPFDGTLRVTATTRSAPCDRFRAIVA